MRDVRRRRERKRGWNKKLDRYRVKDRRCSTYGYVVVWKRRREKKKEGGLSERKWADYDW